jgi:tetraacyldisaccharide 4'-kinase
MAARASLHRHGLLRSARLPTGVISVGNLSLGGSGKTPLVRWIAERLRGAGQPVAVLSRGWGGAHRGDCLIVSDGSRVLADAREAGDEPVWLARVLPECVVAVGRRRDVVGREVLARFGPRLLILDDGFQHLRLHRQLDIVCASPRDLRDWPLPAGRLREFQQARRRAHLVVWMLEPGEEAPAGAAPGSVRARRRPLGFFSTAGDARPAPGRAWLLSGIARPERFAADIGGLAAVVGHSRFPDHHRYSNPELEAALRRARDAGAALVTTEKDAVRLDPGHRPERELLVFRSALEILDEAPFLERLLLTARRAA